MKFKIDENLPTDIKARFAAAGYDCETVYDEQLSGAEDRRIVQVCKIENRILITCDLDFADQRYYPPVTHAGLIILRLNRYDKVTIMECVRGLIDNFKIETVQNRLWIVSGDFIRIRD